MATIHMALEHKSTKEHCLPCFVQGPNIINDACRSPNDGEVEGVSGVGGGWWYYYYYYTEKVLMCELGELR